MTWTRPGILVLALVLAGAGTLPARTIVITAEDCEQMAFLSGKVPHLAWAGMMTSPKVYNAENQVHFFPDSAILMKLSLAKIPKDSRITKAELFVPADYVGGATPSMSIRRVVAEWGHGVNHKYRLQYPKKIEWAQPGARGGGTDRATKDTAVIRIEKVGEYSGDVTEDVELWYTEAAPNRGWIFTNELASGVLYLGTPYGVHTAAAKRWKLQITYEPK